MRFSFLVFAAFAAVSVSHAKDIVHDGEYRYLERQFGEQWAAEDAEVDGMLESVIESKGGKRPNILYILVDDVGFGGFGIPETELRSGYTHAKLSMRSLIRGYL